MSSVQRPYIIHILPTHTPCTCSRANPGQLLKFEPTLGSRSKCSFYRTARPAYQSFTYYYHQCHQLSTLPNYVWYPYMVQYHVAPLGVFMINSMSFLYIHPSSFGYFHFATMFNHQYIVNLFFLFPYIILPILLNQVLSIRGAIPCGPYQYFENSKMSLFIWPRCNFRSTYNISMKTSCPFHYFDFNVFSPETLLYHTYPAKYYPHPMHLK